MVYQWWHQWPLPSRLGVFDALTPMVFYWPNGAREKWFKKWKKGGGSLWVGHSEVGGVDNLGGVSRSLEALMTLEEFKDIEDLRRAVETIDEALQTIQDHWWEA